MIVILFDDLDVPDRVRLVYDKNRPVEEPQLLDEHSVVDPEQGVPVVRQSNDTIHTGRTAPSLLCEGQVHADHEDNDIIRESRREFVEL